MGIIDEVKQKIDIIEVIGEHTTLTKAGRTYRALCPFHSEKHPSFFVYPEQQSWHCFGACNTGGDVFSFVMKRDNTSFGDALRLLAERAGVKIPSQFEPQTGKDERERLYQVNEAAARYFHNLLLNSPAAEKARNYVLSRGFSSKTVADFRLGFSLNSWESLKQYLLEKGYTENELLTAGLIIEADDKKTHDRFRNRLIFSICDSKGHILGFGARVLDDSLPKYVNSPQTPLFDKSSILYGIDLAAAAIRQQDTAVIVEGYMDVITAHQNGFKNVVAAMGTSVTDKQVSMLKRLTGNVALALDADAAGEEATLRSIGYENILGAEVKVIIMPAGKDPDDVIRDDTRTWQRLLDEAPPIIDFTFDTATAKVDLNTARGKSLAVDKLLPIIAEIKNPVRQAHYLQKLAHLVKVSEQTIETALGKIKLRRTGRNLKESKQEAVTSAVKPLVSSPIEEYCLALLLQYPELKDSTGELLLDYFGNSENREIFIALKEADDLPSLKEKLDRIIHDHLDYLATKSLPPTGETERRHILSNCVLRLREEFLHNLETKREQIFALEAESGGTAAELTKLQELGTEGAVQLREVFHSKGQRHSGAKGVRK